MGPGRLLHRPSRVGAGRRAVVFIGRHFAPQLLGAFEYLPGINPALVDQAREDLIAHGPVALFTGGLEGIPYKLYASQAAGAGMGAGVFLLTSVLARLSRFLLVTGLAWLVGAKLLPNLSLAAKLRIRLGVWLSFYFLYFWQLGV